ncbi:hypothetical protein THARTR1_10437 [Trichoderma harzianum]|uniref:Cytochrome P450 n=1 Tax=Trichoderma harzianum TaxID=5544 RepID=A0A2K0TQE5_TRIHA|nr:hypothetical protein THARTR1_10437 [Trichoderma harzianum]
MLNIPTGLICTSLLLLMTHLYQKWTTARRHHVTALQHGCQPPAKYPHRDPFWGYDLLMERIKAAKDGRQLALYMEHFSIYGKTWEENFLGKRVINTMEMKNIQHVASSGFEDYGKGSNAMGKRFLGDGIFSQDGPEWKHSRDMIKPIFSRSELSDVERLNFHIDRLVNLIPRDGSMIDLQDPINKMFIDSSSEFLFGKSMDLQLNDDDSNDAADFLTAFQACLVGLGKRRLLGHLRHIYDLFDKNWPQSCQKVHHYTDIQIKRALEEISGPEYKSESRYLLIHELAKQIRDPIKLRSQILQIWVPSRDTTALVVNSSIFQLARRPEIWEQLRVESLAIGDEPITFELLRSLKLFKYVVYETLRLQGPSSRVQKVAIRDTILPVGGGPDGKSPLFLEKGTDIILNLWGLHHDKDIWGDDVDQFKPERFADKRFTWDFVPFLGGPRICPAQQQVLTHCVQVLVRLTREFSRIENRDPVMEYVEMWRLLPESRNGIKVALFI